MSSQSIPAETVYTRLITQIHKALSDAGRAPDAAHLTAVSKNQPWEAVAPVLLQGHRCFGENRVQEALSRWGPVRDQYPDLDLRLIGPLQSNKAAEAVAFFDVIETVDRDKIARVLADEMSRQGRTPKLYVQVNIGEEPQKAGVLPDEADAFLKNVRDDYGLCIEGLMCIPPAGVPAAPYFTHLKQIADRNGLDQLSMGMSDDFETAIACGATEIRVGSALFGAR
ncbi:MAG: YggS family pyridoxal phosphate-dependent enzyme [Asticcacaulis sp.]